MFRTTRQNITTHIRNIFREGELEEISVCKHNLHTALDGKSYTTVYYNLDVIISVGYRVRSKRGTVFRQWATKILGDYVLTGCVIDRRFERVEHRIAVVEDNVGYFVQTSLPPVFGVFHDGEVSRANVFVSDLIRSAKASIVMIDNYADQTALTILTDRASEVTADIYTKEITPKLKMDLEKHNAQYEHVSIHETKNVHDRFLIIDGTVYLVGASFKDLGKKLFAISKMAIGDREVLKWL